jgi:hypothetical protein
MVHTSLGEESAEALIRIGGLALRSEVTIGLGYMLEQARGAAVRDAYLDAVFKTVQLF